jgi:pilus assembly protein CpaC
MTTEAQVQLLGDNGLRQRGPAAGKRIAARALALTMATAMSASLSAEAKSPTVRVEARSSVIEIGAGKKSARVVISAGMSETVRTSTSFVDVVIADPTVADVTPLSDRSLSILAKKIGTTRVSVYQDDKSLVGIFDVEVSHDTARLAEELAERFPHARIRVSSVNGRIMLSGSFPDAVGVDQAVTIAKQFSPDIINTLQVSQPQQVLLEVRFVEASRTAGRDLGIRWDVVGDSVAGVIGASSAATTQPFGVLVGRLLGRGIQADVLIRTLEERGVARRLAEPNLVALSGESASFLAGGEFPFPVQSNMGQVSVEFKRFGVGLAFTPTVRANGVINLKIEPEVSQLDPTNVVRVGGIDVPSLVVRRATTTIELRDGQSFAIAGLLQSINQTSQNQLPWLGDVPILGTLFRSAAYQKKETDLAIIVTPRLVRPGRPGDPIRTPLDNSVAANDADFFLMGQAELSPNQAKAARGEPPALVGHILDLPQRSPHVAVR